MRIHYIDTPVEMIRAPLQIRNALLPPFNFYIDPATLVGFGALFEAPQLRRGRGSRRARPRGLSTAGRSMNHPAPNTAGSRRRLARDNEPPHLKLGTVVCSIDRGKYSPAYPRDVWGYLGRGVLVLTDAAGLIHYDEPDDDMKLIARAQGNPT